MLSAVKEKLLKAERRRKKEIICKECIVLGRAGPPQENKMPNQNADWEIPVWLVKNVTFLEDMELQLG